MREYTIHLIDDLHPAGWALLHESADVQVSGPFYNLQKLQSIIEEVDALVISSRTTIDNELIQQARRLKVIAVQGVLMSNFDLDLITRSGILVISAPETNVTAVAEYTLAVLLSLARQIPEGYIKMKLGNLSDYNISGFILLDKYLGIIGFGRIGRQVANLARGFGMHILVYDPYTDVAYAQSQGVELVSISELLRRSDIITLHPSLSTETIKLINREALSHVKPGAYLINTAHEALVDEDALLEALNNGKIAGAALDTLSLELPIPENLLVRHPKVIATPHLNQATAESQAETARQIISDLLDALRQDDYRNIVNLPFSEAIPYRQAKPYIHLATKLGKLQGQLAEGRIVRLEIELLGPGLQNLVKPIAAALLAGMLRPVHGIIPNWVSAPILAHEQGIIMSQVKGLVRLEDYPNLITCRIYWEVGHRTVAGVLFGNGEARLVQYDRFHVDAYPDGYVLILENEDIPGVIGKVGTRLGQAGINIAQWRYGRDRPGGRAVSFINLDQQPPASILRELEQEPEIYRARLTHL